MRILYIPLDERPCNYHYPQQIACLQPQLQLVAPPLQLLGNKKQAADVDRLWQWMFEVLHECDCAILSLEMLIYGGLLPSRLHQLSRKMLSKRLRQFRTISDRCPGIRILASTLIMRAPTYSSSEEEPDYYEVYGDRLFKWGWLRDRDKQVGLTELEHVQLASLSAEIPADFLEDYRNRRQKNLEVNLAAINLVADGVLDFLTIPQDDCAEFGFTASDRQQVYHQIEVRNLHEQIHVYPGADEVGCSLLARTYAQQLPQAIKIYPFFSSQQGSQVIPLYEDRPIAESTRLQIQAAGAEVANTLTDADVVLAVHVPNSRSIEAKDQSKRDEIEARSLSEFVRQIQQLSTSEQPVGVADVAFANGGDTELVKLMDRIGCWDTVLAYGGWNTCCNSLGSTISTVILGLGSGVKDAISFNTIYHLLEDWGYQAIVRWELVDVWLPKLGATYFDFNDRTAAVEAEIGERLKALWKSTFRHSFQDWAIESLDIHSPWQRMFEIGMKLEIRHRTRPCKLPQSINALDR